MKFDIHIDLNANIITGATIALIGACQQNAAICGIGALLMFGRKGLDKAVEIAKIYADKNDIK